MAFATGSMVYAEIYTVAYFLIGEVELDISDLAISGWMNVYKWFYIKFKSAPQILFFTQYLKVSLHWIPLIATKSMTYLKYI